ncbi:hypothetical protein NAC44_15610 [Allorhizobium sp. BGMRC 0089]|uniref:hypothetical protein n=1 Tax=Allorhizobium sonneratiae TaxID=2934936 RepID=UPI00203483F2|nr:hypothetical protein [Allorhizobium sonneratiae]MCM2293755.1 hypothetical protein [Allorhizobium sonneratiae]
MRKLLFLSALSSLLALASCATKQESMSDNSAYEVMNHVMVSAHSCWFKSGDPAFKPYRMDAELNSFSGKPRILLVRKGSKDIRPVLVVMAEGSPAKVQVFGPMMGETIGERIGHDVTRWSGGNTSCN